MNFLINYQSPVALNVEIKQESLVTHNIINCAYCNQTFNSKKDLKDHKQREHKQIQQNIKAETKAKKAKSQASQSSYNSHYVPHQPKFQCEYCFKGFDQSHRLKQHQISHREPVFNCDQVCILLSHQLCNLVTPLMFNFSAKRSSNVNIA